MDCLDGSHGERCESCLAGYIMSEDNECVQPRITATAEETTVPIIIKATTPKTTGYTNSGMMSNIRGEYKYI